MKNRFFASLTFVLLCGSAMAQPMYRYSGASATIADSTPLNRATYNKKQMLYYPSDFQGVPSGSISSVYFRAPAADTFRFNALTVKMGYTTLDSFVKGPFFEGTDTVFHASPAMVYTIADEWVEIKLQRPFYYDSTRRFVVTVSQTGKAPGFNMMCDNMLFSRGLYGSVANDTASDTTLLPDFGFNFCKPGVVLATAPGSRCGEGPVSLQASTAPNSKLKWYSAISGGAPLHTGGVFNIPLVSVTTDFYVAADSARCESKRIPVTATVKPAVTGTMTVNGRHDLCLGDTVLLTASSSTAASYQWQKNGMNIALATGPAYTVRESGYYRVIVNANVICYDTTAPELILMHILPNPQITAEKRMLSTGMYDAYQWNRNTQPIPGATSREHEALLDGDYTVTVTDSNGCVFTSGSLRIGLGVGDLVSDDEPVSIYPNPAVSTVYVDTRKDAAYVMILGMDGKTVLERRTPGAIPVGDLAEGLYIIRAFTVDGRPAGTGKMIKAGR